jgi:microcystin-dependent protein
MGTDTVTVNAAGGGQAVAVRDPYLGMRYCIATVGIFPSRN